MLVNGKTKKEKAIIFVESPGKCPTIRKYLSGTSNIDYDVMATFGHIQQLPSKKGSVFLENEKIQFLWEHKGENVNKIIKAITETRYDAYYIATDPDREGEGIGEHLWRLLVDNNCDKEKIFRITFNEITKSAIEYGIKNPGKINKNLVNAYLSRLGMDYLIGYGLSPLAWRLGSNYSVGRVQTSGLKIIVEKEEEIFNFIEETYYVLHGVFDGLDLLPKLIKYNGEETGRITGEDRANDMVKDLLEVSNKEYVIYNVVEKEIKKNPLAPFATGSLQQEAATKLGFSVSMTMSNAQKLYEEGLITYMRTDSTIISDEAIAMIRNYVEKEYGSQYLHGEVLTYTTKIKNAQEAHEAIRPTDISNNGSAIENEYHRKLYELIWKRTVACQMTSAIYKKKDIFIKNEVAEFTLSGSQLKFLGYLKVYGREEGEDNLLPDLQLNTSLMLKDINNELHKTKHSPRYTEGGLVKSLQKKGIGRPSTYGLIIEILKKREYVRIHNKGMYGLMRGKILIGFLEVFLPKYIDYNFTAEMEESLDKIANGEIDWEEFLVTFQKNLTEDIKRVMAIQLFPMLSKINPILQKWIKYIKCKKCGHDYDLYIKSSLYFCCSSCKATLSLKDNFTFKQEDSTEEEINEDKKKKYQKKTFRKATGVKKSIKKIKE